MGGRKPLQRGARRLLGHHGNVEGRSFRACYDALLGELGPFSVLQAMEASRVAANWVALEQATKAHALARQKRVSGRGKKPSARDVERLARRQGLADGTYSTSLERLRALVASKNQDAGRPIGSGVTLRVVGLAEEDV